MRAYLPLVLCLLLGCSASTVDVAVITDLRLDEDSMPLQFVVAINNDGDSAAEIREVSVNVLGKTLISRSQDKDRIPTGCDYEVTFGDDHPREIPADSEGAACGFLAWKLP